MSDNATIFNVVQFLASVYVAWRGGAPERWTALLLLLAAIATYSVPVETGVAYFSVFWPVLWIDLALLAGLTAIALSADRFWPLWLAALQLMAVAAHGVRGAESSVWAIAYWLMTGKIAYPMLGLLIVGSWRHHQRSLAGLPDYAWTFVRHVHERRAQQGLEPGRRGGGEGAADAGADQGGAGR